MQKVSKVEDWKLLKLFRIAPRTIKRLELEEKWNDGGKEQEDFNIILEKRDEKERNKKRNEESSPDPSAKNIGGAERFAQRVEINRRPSSFNGPSPPPLFLQRLGINPGSAGEGGLLKLLYAGQAKSDRVVRCRSGGCERGAGGGVVSRFRGAIAFSVFSCVFLER